MERLIIDSFAGQSPKLDFSGEKSIEPSSQLLFDSIRDGVVSQKEKLPPEGAEKWTLGGCIVRDSLVSCAAFEGNREIGSISGSIGSITALVVSDSFRGQGVGTDLVNAFVEISSINGAPWVDYQSPTRSVRGILEKAGFIPITATNWRKYF